MSFALNRPGRGSSRGAQRPTLLSGGARHGEADFRRLNHTASGRLGTRCDTRQDGLLQDSDIKPDLQRATNVSDDISHDRKIASHSLPAYISKSSRIGTSRGGSSSDNRGKSANDSGPRSFSNDYDIGSFQDDYRRGSCRNEYGRESFGNSYGKRSAASMDSGVSVGSAAGSVCGGDTDYGRDRMKSKNQWGSGRSSGRMRTSMNDSGYTTNTSMRSLSSSTGRGETTIRDVADRLEEINLRSDNDDECSSGGRHPTLDGSVAETSTSLHKSDTPNPLEERLKREAPQVLAKRLIYKKYLQKYIPSMMSIRDKQIKVIDGFAGTGRATELDWPTEIEHYETPIIALRVALHYFRAKDNLRGEVIFDNARQFDVSGYLSGIEDLRMFAYDRFEIAPADKHRVVLVFFEHEKNAYKELVKNVIKIITMYRVRVDEEAHFKDGFCKVRCDFKGTKRANNEYLVACYIVHADLTKVAPVSGSDVLVLNSKGDTVVPLDVVKRMTDSRKQIFLTLDIRIDAPNTNHGQVANKMSSNGRLTKTESDAYEQSLKQSAKADCFLSLETQGYTSTVIGHMLFRASHISNFKKMKEAMNEVRESLQSNLICCFTNYKTFKEPYQLRLPQEDKESDRNTANAIFQRFRGKESVLSEVERYVWTETPYVFRKKPLKILEVAGKLFVKTDDQTRKKGTFPDRSDWNLVFSQ